MKWPLRVCDVDGAGLWRPDDLWTAMQEAAGMDCHLQGFGRTQLADRGLVWVVARSRLDMERWPKLFSTVTVTTWGGGGNAPLFYRGFSFADEQGPLGTGNSAWVVADIETHQMAAAADCAHIPSADPAAPALRLPRPAKLRLPEGAGLCTERRCLYSDIDANGHMNNARYVQWVMDLLPPETMAGRRLRHLQVNYLSETRPGETLRLRLQEGEVFWVAGEAADGRPVFEAQGAFCPA